jgi:hypothetical protein
LPVPAEFTPWVRAKSACWRKPTPGPPPFSRRWQHPPRGELLEARAQFDSPERAVRVAEHNGHVYLSDQHWRAVEIGAEGWRVVSFPPMRFRRLAGLLPLPVPQRGSSIEFGSLLNLPDQNDQGLAVAWLWAALIPILAISGEQGSAKTVLTNTL